MTNCVILNSESLFNTSLQILLLMKKTRITPVTRYSLYILSDHDARRWLHDVLGGLESIVDLENLLAIGFLLKRWMDNFLAQWKKAGLFHRGNHFTWAQICDTYSFWDVVNYFFGRYRFWILIQCRGHCERRPVQIVRWFLSIDNRRRSDMMIGWIFDWVFLDDSYRRVRVVGAQISVVIRL